MSPQPFKQVAMSMNSIKIDKAKAMHDNQDYYQQK